MKILFIVNKDITLYLFRKELVTTLLSIGHEIKILTPAGDKVKYFESIGCTVELYDIDRRGKNPFKEFITINKYRKVIKDYEPDYIYTYTIKPNLYVGVISRFKKIKFIPTITGLGTELNKKTITSKLIKMLYRIAFKKPYYVFFQNEENLNWFKENINNKINAILVSGSGVNLKQFSYKEYPNSEITKFLFLGRIMKDKGIDELIYATKKLKGIYKEKVEVRIAGFFEESFQSQIEELGKNGVLEYLGYLDNTLNLLEDSSAVVLPSYHEGLSNVLLEAQAVGRPVIASNIPGCKETFIEGISGYLIEVKNGEDLFFKMEKFHLLSWNLKKKMGLMGRTHVEENFDRNYVVEKYISIIE